MLPTRTHAEGRWRRLRALLEEALGKPEGARDAFLSEACGDDRELLAEARRLLAEDAREDVLPEPPRGELIGSLGSDPGSEEGRRVGPYELRSRIGAGGMGTVYLAVRADGEFRQRVAIKLLSGGHGPEIAARFRRERQVLANLEHPSVARLIDGGVDERGAPYLVMEYVEGVRIDRYCDEGNLGIRERLALFREVCEAVSHAHRSLVVHRDIKPSNILVTPEGRAKLLDFGVAKVLDPEKASEDPEVTLSGGFLTPAYASPEQVRGRPITAASDVYSLGVLLYQLLTGRMPYAVETTSAVAIARAVCETEPLPPSQVVETALARRLRGDLDTIVAKALKKEPQRRYASAEQLSGDVQRHLDRLPILARPDSFGYRASRFVARNRVPVAAGVLAFLGLGVGLVVATTQYRRAEAAYVAESEERGRADARADELEILSGELQSRTDELLLRSGELELRGTELEEERRVAQERLDQIRAFATELVFDLHRELHPLEGSARAKELVLDMGLRYLDEIARDSGGDADLQRKLAGGYLRMGEVKGDPHAVNLGDPDQALAIYEKAVGLAEAAFAAEPEDPRSGFGLAQALLKIGDLHAALGDLDRAHGHFRRGLELEDELVGMEDPPPGNLYFAFLLRDRNAADALRRGEIDMAEESVEAGRAHLEAAIERMPALAHERYIPFARGAEVAGAAGRFEEAADLRAEAVAILARATAAAPGNAVLARNLRFERMRLTQSLAFLGRSDEALAEIEPVVAELERLVERNPEDAQASRDLLDVLRRCAKVRIEQGDGEGAVADAERCLDMAREQGTGLPARDLARVFVVTGEARQAVGLLSAARDALVEANRILAELEGQVPGDPMLLELTLRAHHVLARVDLDQAESLAGDEAWRAELLQEAERHLRAALALYERNEASLATPLVVGEAVRAELIRLVGVEDV